MTSSEQIARTAYEGLPVWDKLLVMSWRQLGNAWFTSVVNSGVLSTGWRLRPEEAARERERDRIEQVYVERLQQLAQLMPTDAALRRRQAAEHEAAHTVVAQALGVVVRVAHIAHDGCGGACLHEHGSPFETAVIALAGEMWVRTFRSREFPRGPTGCESDRRAAIAAVGGDNWELKRAYKQ